MNKEFNDIHTLCEEVLPLYEELNNEAQRIIDRHINECPICNQKRKDTRNLEHILTESTEINLIKSNQPIKKFSKLIWIKNTAFWITILFKVIVLILIGQDFLNLATMTEAPLGLLDEGVRASMILYYLPISFFTHFLSVFLVKKRYIFIVLIVDILLFIYFDDFLVGLVS